MNKTNKNRLLLLIVLFLTVCFSVFTQFEHFIDNEKNGLTGFTATNHSGPVMENQTAEFFLTSQGKAHSVNVLLVPPAEKGGSDVVLSVYSQNSQLLCVHNITEKDYAKGQFVTIPLGFEGTKGTGYRITLHSEETDVSKATRIVVGSAAATDVYSWTVGEQRYGEIPSLSLVYSDVKTMSVLIVVASLMVIAYTIFALLFKEKNKVLDLVLDFGAYCACLALIVVAVYVVETMQWANLLGFSAKVIIANILIVLGLSVLFYTITGRLTTATAIAVIVSLLLGISNHYLIEFRGTVLLPSDLTGLSTAAKVAGTYIFVLADSVLCAIALIISSVAFAFYPLKKDSKNIKQKVIARAAAFVLGIAMLVVPSARPDLFGTEVYLWKQQTGSRTMNGFLLNFAANVPLLIRQQPEGYDVSKLESYVDVGVSQTNEQNTVITEKQTPNILFVMNESFADPRTVFDVKDSELLLPNLDRLKTDKNAFVGQTAVSVFGGGTSCSEYETLTGFSIRTDNANTAPYLTYFHENTPSLVWYLNNLGYNTSSYHPATSINWYRNTAYPYMGFERTVFLNESNNTLNDSMELLSGEKLIFDSKFSNFPSDMSGYKLVMDMMKESEEPVFNFHITLQNHGAYSDMDVEYDISADEWSTYLKLMNHSDAQLGQFLEMLEAFEEPTVVVFFGDHWSYYDESKLASADLALDTMTQQQLTDYYSTPYVVWSNCGYDFSSLPQQTSLSYLSSLVMNQLGFELTQWQNFLIYLSEKIPVYSVYNIQSNVSQAEYDDYIYRLQCLHYNALNDSKNRNTNIFGIIE